MSEHRSSLADASHVASTGRRGDASYMYTLRHRPPVPQGACLLKLAKDERSTPRHARAICKNARSPYIPQPLRYILCLACAGALQAGMIGCKFLCRFWVCVNSSKLWERRNGSNKRVKRRSHTAEERISMRSHRPHATSQPSLEVVTKE